MTLPRIAALSLLAVALAAPAQAESERSFRTLTLGNGLRVVLASDPEVNLSSASLVVGIGANADPLPGLAHFLEHMLFLSNEKYPELNAYGNFLQSRGGMSNAYTSADHTNYHFQVNHEGLPEALDRFAQFFISPTLDYTYAEREVAAVHSEHQKNVMDDTWRLMQLQRNHLRKGHPASGFSTGSQETLAEAREEALRGFFKAYYSAPNMALAVLSQRSLDDLERLVRDRFAAIRDDAPQAWAASPDLLEEVQALRILRVVPVKDLRQLRIYFEVPAQHPHRLQKLSQMVGLTMGDEGPGSLLSYLKQLGLASTLSAGVTDTRFYSACQVTVGLTPAGLERWREVMRLCFAYTRLLREEGFPRHVWEEMRTLTTLRQRYSARPEGTQAVIDLANHVLEYGLEAAPQAEHSFAEPDPAAYQALVDALVPANSLVFLVAKGLQTDQTETHYGTEYAFTREEGEAFQSLAQTPIPAELTLPPPNPFVPRDVSVLAEQPTRLVADEGLTLWHHQDTEFKRPKLSLTLHLLSPQAYGSARAAALTELYAAVVSEQLNELSYPALMAGLSFSLSATRRGLLLNVSGYTDSSLRLLEMVSGALRAPLDEGVAERVRERSVQGLRNFPLGQAYMVATQLARKLSLRRYYLPEERLPVLEGVSFADLQLHAGNLLARVHIEGLAAGNLSAARAGTVVRSFQAALGARPCSPDAVPEDAVLWLEPNEQLSLQRVGQTNNACLRLEYQLGSGDLETRVAAEALARAFRNPFYTEMRTKQKLGYIVWSGTYERKNVQNVVFIIQSSTHSAPELLKRAQACVDGFPALLAKLSAEQFEAIRAGLIEERRQPAKTIAEQAGRFFTGAFEHEGDFGRREREVEALQRLTREELVERITRCVAPETRRTVSYLLNATQHPPFASSGSVSDLASFPEGRTYSEANAPR